MDGDGSQAGMRISAHSHTRQEIGNEHMVDAFINSNNPSEMEDIPLSEEFKKSQTVKRKETTEENNAVQMNASSGRSGSRRTRSQIAPDWSGQDTLTLVNEKIAVERECGDAVSTFQKWTYVAENLTAMDVVRNVNRCRRKWESLLEDYRAIRGWVRKSKNNAYWLLDIQGRKRAGLPLDFDQEVYGAIDDFVKIQPEHSGSDPDTDPDLEAEVEVLNAKKSGSKKPQNRPTPHYRVGTTKADESVLLSKTKSSSMQRHKSTPCKGVIVDNKHIPLTGEKKCALTEAETAKKPHIQSTPRKGNDMKANERMLAKDVGQLLEETKISKMVHHRSTARKRNKKGNGHSPTEKVNKNFTVGGEERKPFLAERLRKNAELINSIVAENVCRDDEFYNSADVEALKIRRARHKAEKLISCLNDLANDLNLLDNEVEKS